MPDPIKDLYNSVKTGGLFIDENDFRTQLTKSPKEIFPVVSSLFIDYNDFESQIGLKKKDGGITSPVSPLPSRSKNLLAKVPDELPLGIPQPQSVDYIHSNEVAKAKAKVDSILKGSDDIYQRVIKEDRLNQFDTQLRSTPTLDGFVNPAAQTAKRDIVKVIPVTQEQVAKKKEEVFQDPNATKDILRRSAKKDPEVAKSAYLIDSEERIAKDPSRVGTVIGNANKIASGELTYDIKSGRLQKPEGVLMSTYRGFQERNRQMDDYKFFTETLNEDAIISQLNADMKDYDPERPMPVPDGGWAGFGQSVGMEGIAMAKGAGAATITAAIPGAQGLAPYVAAFAASPEYYKRGYSSALRQAYYEQVQKGVPETEALKVARKQAETEANLSAAEGFASGLVGARIGLKPTTLKLGGGFKNAVNNTMVSVSNFAKENLAEGAIDGTVAGGLQIAKNLEAINNGLDRKVFDGVQENIAGELEFAFGLGLLTKAGKFAINPKSLNTIVTGIAQQPKEVVDAKLGEMVVTGKATPNEVIAAGKTIEEARTLNTQIPQEITDEESRAEIADKIKTRQALKNELATANEVFHEDIKNKIKAVDEEIVGIVNTQRSAETQPEGGLSVSPELSIIDSLSPDQIQVTSDATEFANQMTAAQNSLGKAGMSVSPYPQEDYDQIASEGGKFLRAADNKILALLKPNGEMVSLVKDATVKTKGAAQAMISKMKDMGGLFMDNYDIYLTPIYEKAGYKVVARVPFNEEYAESGWDAEDSPLKNKPDVVFMVRKDLAPDQAQTFQDYGDAQAFTQGLVDKAVADGVAKLPTQISTDIIANELLGELGSPIDTALEAAIPNATKALDKANIKFQVVDGATNTDFAKAARGNQGLFVAEDGTIIIDKSKLQDEVEAGLVVWHEASHPVMNIIRNTNKPLYDAVVRGLNEAAGKNTGVAGALNWAQSQEQYDNADTQNDEAIVETIGRINSGLIDVASLDAGFRQKLIDFVNSIAKFFGIDPILNDTDLAAFKKTVSDVADALKTGRDISEIVGAENVKEYMNNLNSPEIVAGGQLAPQARPENAKINVYESKEVSKLPERSMQEIYDQFGGKAVVINSDPTRVGELTLPSAKKIFMYGGPAYLSVKDNVDGNVGFATTQLSKVQSWSKYVKELFGNENGVTFVATQAPTAILSNSYSLRYVMDAISMLPKSVLRSSDFKSEFFGKDLVLLKDAFGEKGYNEFVNKYKKADLSNPEVIDGMIAEMAYKVGDNNKPASFKARGAFVSNLLGGLDLKSKSKSVEGDTGYYSKSPKKYIARQLFERLGINTEKVIREIGEPSLVDLYMNEGVWGIAVSGFETDPNLTIESVQEGGVNHPLFNAKFPGKNPFILDGAYEVNKMFTPIEMTGPKGGAYTKTAAQMLAGSMYVKGQPSQTESSFKYVTTQSSGNRIQASVGNRPESSFPFKVASFVMRKLGEGANKSEIAQGVMSATGMSAEEVKKVMADPEQYIRDSFPELSNIAKENLVERAKVQNIYRGRQFGMPINKAFVGAEVPRSKVVEYLNKTKMADKTFMDSVKDFKNKWLNASKGLPNWLMAVKDFAVGRKNIEIARAIKTIEQLKEEANKIGFVDWDAFSKAMVAASDVKRFIPDEDGLVMFDPVRSSEGKMFTTPDDMLPAVIPDAIKALPESIRPFAVKMRQQIDGLTKDLIGSGYVTPEQAVTLEKNIGQYVNRAYKMFNERGFKPNPDQVVDAIKFIADQKFKQILSELFPAGKPSKSKEVSDFKGNVIDADSVNIDELYNQAVEEAKKDVQAIVDKKRNPYFNAKTDSRDTGILKEKKDIPEPIRKLMGEYTDPGAVFIMTVAKQAALASQSEYLNKLRDFGMGSIFYEKNDKNRPAEFSVEVAPAGSETKNPLGGLYTTPEIAEALEMADPSYNELTNMWMKLVGAVRWGKTVGSVATQAKNFESNIGFAVLNGMFLTGENTQALKAASKYVKGQYSKAEMDAITEKAVKLNLVGQSVGARELSSMLGSGDIHDIALEIAANPNNAWGKKVKKKVNVFGAANKLYRMGDDFWKVYAYINERETVARGRYKSSYESLSKEDQDKVDIESSERVKNTWPTYDRVVEAAKYVSKRAPIFGNFISFQAESLRVLANSIRMAKDDIKDPDMKSAGIKRAVGIMTYLGLRTAITYGAAQAAGMAVSGVLGAAFGDDEEEQKKRAFKKAMPIYARTADIAIVPTDAPHKFTAFSLSSLDPYGIIPNSLNAFTEGREGIFSKEMQPGVRAASAEFFSGFLEPEMTFSTMYSVMNNINPKTGRPIVLDSDTDAEVAAKVASFIVGQLEPSTLSMIERGMERGWTPELASFAGARPIDIDLHKSFGFAMTDMGKQMDAIKAQYNSIKYNEKSTDAEKAEAEAEAERKKAFLISKVAETYRDFIKVGASPKVLDEMINERSAIKTTGFDKVTKMGIKTGEVKSEKLFK